VYPAGFDEKGLPIGVQLIAMFCEKIYSLQVAYAYEQSTDWHLHTPQLDSYLSRSQALAWETQYLEALARSINKLE
jgi:hypothetical protein